MTQFSSISNYLCERTWYYWCTPNHLGDKETNLIEKRKPQYLNVSFIYLLIFNPINRFRKPDNLIELFIYLKIYVLAFEERSCGRALTGKNNNFFILFF